MKVFELWVLLFMVGTALWCLNSSIPAMAFNQREKDMTGIPTRRNLKDDGYSQTHKNSDAGKINLEDYRPIDPVPSSKASIRPGPIQHGTPLMPYIPKPTPPPAPGNPKWSGLP